MYVTRTNLGTFNRYVSLMSTKKLSFPDVCQCCLSASLNICSSERWAGGVGKGVDLSRDGGVGGGELGRDMLEEEGRVGLRKRVGGREGRRLAAAGDAGGW